MTLEDMEPDGQGISICFKVGLFKFVNNLSYV